MLATPHPVHFEKLSSIGPRSVAGLETTRERAVPRLLFFVAVFAMVHSTPPPAAEYPEVHSGDEAQPRARTVSRE